MNVLQLIELAEKHSHNLPNNHSATLCYGDAVMQYGKFNIATARERALASLQHSIGVFHPDYKRAKNENS